ncbi:MAG: cadherin-like beta sandwich domain-containing protein [bacterium]|nr:cadherin-like beta sandwich domain-containing protein [bacterium]
MTREDGRSSNNSLKSLSVSNTNINFDKNITTYNLSVKNDIETIEISAQADDNNILYLIIISKKTKTKDFINNTNS